MIIYDNINLEIEQKIYIFYKFDVNIEMYKLYVYYVVGYVFFIIEID